MGALVFVGVMVGAGIYIRRLRKSAPPISNGVAATVVVVSATSTATSNPLHVMSRV